MVPVLLGPQKRLDQIRVVDATTESMTIRYPRAFTVPKYTADGIGFVVTILDIKPNVFTLHWLVAALAVAFDTHLRPDSNL